jgi:putative nucleotidyltransferase with HDIG domain
MPDISLLERKSRSSYNFLAGGAHCSRVAAFAMEIARVLNLNQSRMTALTGAAWLHDDLSCTAKGASSRLMEDLLRIKGAGEAMDFRAATPEVVRILRVFHRASSTIPNEDDARLAAILHLANSFDEAFEWLQFESGPGSEIIRELESMTGLWPQEVFGAFLSLSAGRREVAIKTGERLPVSVVGALRALAASPVDSLTVNGLTKLALRDTAIAAELLRAANSAAYATRQPIVLVQNAISYIGIVNAREVMMAAAARGLFASANLGELWAHSIQCAKRMKVAAVHAGCNPEEAFVVGLLHDIGRVAMELSGTEARARLRESQAPAIWIEVVTVGCDHAELGAGLLSKWNLPARIVDAVRYHHHPDLTNSRLAALMCAVEFREDANEDLLSDFRLDSALAAVGIDEDKLEHSTSSVGLVQHAAG